MRKKIPPLQYRKVALGSRARSKSMPKRVRRSRSGSRGRGRQIDSCHAAKLQQGESKCGGGEGCRDPRDAGALLEGRDQMETGDAERQGEK